MEIITLLLELCLLALLLVAFALLSKDEVSAELKLGWFKFSIVAKGSKTDGVPR